jgi:predicted O-methyltransferase YrrM
VTTSPRRKPNTLGRLTNAIRQRVSAAQSYAVDPQGAGTALILSRLDKLSSELSDLKRDLIRAERTSFQQGMLYHELRAKMGDHGPMPALRGWSISPDLALELITLLETHAPKTMLDLGSGFSTIILARHAITVAGATVATVDGDAGYLTRTVQLAKAWGVDSVVTPLCCPVVKGDGLGPEKTWYDPEPIEALGRAFDFVFIDGPPQSFGLKVRGGLLPRLAKSLAAGCIIVMDDCYREGELAVIAAWRSAGLVEVIEINTHLEKHMAVLRFRGGTEPLR